MKKLELVCWEPLISPHKMGLFEALATSEEVAKVSQIAQKPLSDDRKELGWQVSISPVVPTIISPSDEQITEAVVSSSPDAIHIFSGIHWVPSIVKGIALAIRYNRRFGIMSEPRTFEGTKGFGRLAHSWFSERQVRKHADFVLAIGRHGPPWFRMAGYPAKRIYPFAYFVDEKTGWQRKSSSPKVRIGYLGRLIQAKGFDLAVEAFRLLGADLEFDIAGSGELEPLARALAMERSDAVTFRGTLPMAAVASFLAAIDLLIVPSRTRDDGWGVVTTEALQAGAAVIISNFPGSSICISDARFGRRVNLLTPQAIANAIQAVIASGVLQDESRRFRSEWASAHLTSSAGARYLLDILAHIYDRARMPQPLFLLK